MLLKFKHALTWVKTHSTLTLVLCGTLVVSILSIFWGKKNRRIHVLEEQLAVAYAKTKIMQLESKYNVNMHELHELKEKDEKLTKELSKVADTLRYRLSAVMTAEEIADQFKELGL